MGNKNVVKLPLILFPDKAFGLAKWGHKRCGAIRDVGPYITNKKEKKGKSFLDQSRLACVYVFVFKTGSNG